MANYEVFIAEEYDKQLSKMNKSEQAFIERKMKDYVIPQLKSEPYFGSNIKKLKNYNPPTWRFDALAANAARLAGDSCLFQIGFV